MKSVTAAQMRELDRRTIEAGTPGKTLMERAGVGVARAMFDRWLEHRAPIVVLAGKGNNGGDAFVVARHLALRTKDQVTLALACTKNEIKGDALYHFRRVPEIGEDRGRGEDRLSIRASNRDGLLGTGLSGEVRSPYRELIERINATTRAYVVAIDIPSGMHADTGEPLGVAVRADLTVTMGLPKIGLLKPAATDWVGELELVDIGIPSDFICETPGEVELIAASDVAPLFPRRKRSAHKGDYGHLLVLAGAEGYTAPRSCARRLRHARAAGLVTLGVPRRIYPVVASSAVR